jgi:hypothetical protein
MITGGMRALHFGRVAVLSMVGEYQEVCHAFDGVCCFKQVGPEMVKTCFS